MPGIFSTGFFVMDRIEDIFDFYRDLRKALALAACLVLTMALVLAGCARTSVEPQEEQAFFDYNSVPFSMQDVVLAWLRTFPRGAAGEYYSVDLRSGPSMDAYIAALRIALAALPEKKSGAEVSSAGAPPPNAPAQDSGEPGNGATAINDAPILPGQSYRQGSEYMLGRKASLNGVDLPRLYIDESVYYAEFGQYYTAQHGINSLASLKLLPQLDGGWTLVVCHVQVTENSLNSDIKFFTVTPQNYTGTFFLAVQLLDDPDLRMDILSNADFFEEDEEVTGTFRNEPVYYFLDKDTGALFAQMPSYPGRFVAFTWNGERYVKRHLIKRVQQNAPGTGHTPDVINGRRLVKPEDFQLPSGSDQNAPQPEPELLHFDSWA